MPIDDVLRNLESEANTDIAWAFGDILRGWCLLPDWRTSVLLQHLETGNRYLAVWNEIIRNSRRALVRQEELQIKARTLLAPRSARLNEVMDDFVAEMLAAQYLSARGHTEIHFLSDDDPIHTDLQSRLGDRMCVTEVKNLHEPVGLTKIALGRWNHNKVASPERYKFAAELSDLDDPLSDLTPEQLASVNALIDELPQWKRPSRQIRSLPGGRRLSVKVRDEAHSVIVTHGGGPFRVDGAGGIVAKGQQGLTMKLLEHTRKALSQLYADQVPDDSLRLLYVRWKPPEQFVVAPNELDDVRKIVQEGLRLFVSLSFPHCAIIITHTHENPDQTPAVQWQ
jgi:hypothetical protein